MESMPKPVLTSGFPKAGNHALVKACELLGLPAEVTHRPYSRGFPVGMIHLFIKRDPRNIVISKIREEGKTPTPGRFMTRVRAFSGGRSLAREMMEYDSWLRDGRTHVIRYEDLIASDTVMRDIAEWTGVPYFEGAWEELPGLTVSWRPGHSDYREIWSDALETEWQREGGPALLQIWGYA